MSQLSEYLELIKKEKDTKLLPKNINNGVTIFGVPGNSDFTVKVDATKQSNNNVLASYIVEIKNLDLSYISKTNLSSFFSSLNNLKKISFTSRNNIINMYNIFSGCYQLEEIDFSNVDTSNVTDMSSMFYNCSALTSIPQLNTSKVTSMSSMFQGCTHLTNESLNNILAMCANATSYAGTKTLNYIGLTSAQATTCQGLSNYQAFLDAGWTIGY